MVSILLKIRKGENNYLKGHYHRTCLISNRTQDITKGNTYFIVWLSYCLKLKIKVSIIPKKLGRWIIRKDTFCISAYFVSFCAWCRLDYVAVLSSDNQKFLKRFVKKTSTQTPLE